jgi:hypothetical protein
MALRVEHRMREVTVRVSFARSAGISIAIWSMAIWLVPGCLGLQDRSFCEKMIDCQDREQGVDFDDDAYEVCTEQMAVQRDILLANEESDCHDAATANDRLQGCLLTIEDCDDFLTALAGGGNDCEDERDEANDAANDAGAECIAALPLGAL